MGELVKLPNIGQDTERLLNEIGIETFDQLKSLGAQQAWLGIQEIDPSACYNRLMGLEGAIWGIKKSQLPPQRKAELKEFYLCHKIEQPPKNQ